SNRTKRFCELRIAKDLASGRRSAAGEIQGGRVAIRLERRHATEPLESGNLGDWKSVIGMHYRCRENRVQRLVSELVVERHPAGDGSGYGHRMNACLRHRGHSTRAQKLDRRTLG